MSDSYDTFAPHFDAWQRAFGAPYDELILSRLLDLLAEHALRVRRVADLGIGTGDLVLALARRGFDVVGVDRSAPMLEVARRKIAAAALPRPPVLVRQDLRDLVLDAPLDAAICVYTVMNQLASDDDLARVLAAVRRALVPGGIFVFELNLPAAYERWWRGTDTVTLPGELTVTRRHRRIAGTALIEALVAIETPDGTVHDRIVQRLWGDDEVAQALAAASFARPTVQVFNPFEAGGAPMKALWTARRQEPRA